MPALDKKTKTQNFPPKLFYRREEVAYSLGLSVKSVDDMIADRRLTTRRWGRCVLIPNADVQRVAEAILQHDMLQGSAQRCAE